MIKSFRHKGLKELMEKGATRRMDQQLLDRAQRRLDALEQAQRPEDMNVPGFDFRPLRGKPKRYSVHVNGPWCITFGFEDGDAYDVALENYR